MTLQYDISLLEICGMWVSRLGKHEIKGWFSQGGDSNLTLYVKGRVNITLINSKVFKSIK